MPAQTDEDTPVPALPGWSVPRVPIPLVILGLAIAYLPYWAPGLARQLGHDLSAWGPASAIMWGWLATLVLLAYMRGVERRPLASLRLTRPTEKDVTIAGYLGGAALGWQWLTSQLLPTTATAGAQEGQDTLVGLGPLLALALVVTVSITEEILWRGYAVERVGAWIGRVPAALIGLAIFALGHVTFFGASWLLTNLPGAIALYALLLWRRNLWACMFCHAVLDLPIVLVAVLAAVT